MWNMFEEMGPLLVSFHYVDIFCRSNPLHTNDLSVIEETMGQHPSLAPHHCEYFSMSNINVRIETINLIEVVEKKSSRGDNSLPRPTLLRRLH